MTSDLLLARRKLPAWTPERRARAVALSRDGYTDEQIAALLAADYGMTVTAQAVRTKINERYVAKPQRL